MKYHPNRYIDKVKRSSSPLGYCWCFTHRGYLSTKLLKEHKCLEKNCEFLQKYEEHPFWKNMKLKEEHKKHIKELKKQRKKEQKEELELLLNRKS